uniref:protein-tyrosine-phosphatase n=1 Tax=Caligus clemensi TaxID=344056 RepID=C1C1X7_CALCM|nr:Dual specificity protein phosphatase 12 [Caligus clemensi]
MLTYNYVVHHLFIGERTVATDPELLKDLGVTALVSLDIHPPPTSLEQLCIRIYDTEEEDILSHLPSIIAFISEQITKGKVLVHCVSGVSRSAAAVIAYLMVAKGVSFYEAVDDVIKARPHVQPNDGFCSQLRLFYEMNCTLDITNPQFRFYKFLLKDPLDSCATNFKEYKCFRCSFRVGLDILPHLPSQKMDWRFLQSPLSSTCSKGVFVTSMTAHREENKIKCPSCQFKLGRYYSDQEVKCPCGTILPHGNWMNLSFLDPVVTLDLSSLDGRK